jgi:hypothetical protein
MIILTGAIAKNSKGVRVLVSEKLSHNNVRISSNKLQISSIKFVLKPMLTLLLATLARDAGKSLARAFVFAGWAVAEKYHLKKKLTL